MVDGRVTSTLSIHDVELPYVDLLGEEYQARPAEVLAAARASHRIAKGPFGFLVLGYDEVVTVLRDRRFERPPGLGLQGQGIRSGEIWDRAMSGILSLNGEAHSRQRRLVTPAFKPRAATRLHDGMVEAIAEILDPLVPLGRCDAVTDVARPYPVSIVCDLLGFPREDRPRISAWTDEIFKILGIDVRNAAPGILRAWAELDVYLDAVIDDRRRALGDDLLSQLIRAEEGDERLGYEEIRTLVATILTAGTDTTRNQLAAAFELFCAHPDQWELLAEQPGLSPGAVEEVMRYSPVIRSTARRATEDVELAGLVVPAGTMVSASTAAANRDPEVFDDPESFDITRAPEVPMLTLGGGAHYCLGAHLAKAELETALVESSRRLAGMRATAPMRWTPLHGITGPASVPIAFEAR